jgi:hypothetical protein
MARRRDGGQRPAVATDALPFGQHPVGGIVAVERRVGDSACIIRRKGSRADDGSPGRLCQRAAGRAVVAVVMGDQDRNHRPAGNGPDQRVQMCRVVGPRIDDRHVAVADDMRLRPRIGEGRRVGSEDAGDQRFKQDRDAGRVLSHSR